MNGNTPFPSTRFERRKKTEIKSMKFMLTLANLIVMNEKNLNGIVSARL